MGLKMCLPCPALRFARFDEVWRAAGVRRQQTEPEHSSVHTAIEAGWAPNPLGAAGLL